MRLPDGGCSDIRPEKNSVSLVLFGEIEDDLEQALRDSLAGFFGSLQGRLTITPGIVCRYEQDPEDIPAQNQEQAYFSCLDRMEGNILLGVTHTGFYDPWLSRHLFSYGQSGGRGVLSTYRFRKETGSRRLFLERMGKQILKTLALACTLGSCADTACVVSYHRWARDLDRNRYICETCRTSFARNLPVFLSGPECNPGSSQTTGGV
jgi:predicted Zn-dependent protease